MNRPAQRATAAVLLTALFSNATWGSDSAVLNAEPVEGIGGPTQKDDLKSQLQREAGIALPAAAEVTHYEKASGSDLLIRS